FGGVMSKKMARTRGGTATNRFRVETGDVGVGASRGEVGNFFFGFPVPGLGKNGIFSVMSEARQRKSLSATNSCRISTPSRAKSRTARAWLLGTDRCSMTGNRAL